MLTLDSFSSVHRSWVWLIPLLLLTCWLGARGLNADPIWYDEWWSIYHAGGAQYGPLSPTETWTRVAQEDPRNTPGYYFVLQAWGLFAGWTPYAGRALSLFIGVLTIGWLYRLGRDLVSSAMGLGAAVVLGTGAFFTYYLHELRAYTLYALLTTVCVWAYWRIISRKATWRTQFTLFLSIVGLLYTHYFASLTIAAIAPYHLLFAPKTRLWWRVLVIIGLAGLTFVPWLHVLSQVIGFFQDTGASTWFALDARSAVQISLFMFSNGSIALLVFFALCGLSARRRPVVLIWFWALAALGIGLFVNQALQVLLHVRYLMALWPVLALIVGLGADRLARRGVPLTVLLGIWILTGLWTTFDADSMDEIRDTPYYLPWNTLAKSLTNHVQNDDLLLFLLPDQRPVRRSVHEPVADFYLHDLPIRHELMESREVIGEGNYDRQAQELLSNVHRAWVAYDPTKRPDHIDELDDMLIESHILCGTIADTAQLHLNLYAQLPADEADVTVGFGDEIEAIPLLPTSITDGRLNVMMVWRVAEDMPQYTYSTALHLENADGELVAQADYGLPTESYSCNSTDVDVSSLPPGEYSLWLMVYNSSSGELLAVEAGATDDNRAAIGTIRIEG